MPCAECSRHNGRSDVLYSHQPDGVIGGNWFMSGMLALVDVAFGKATTHKGSCSISLQLPAGWAGHAIRTFRMNGIQTPEFG